jgi:SNF2 family DNA or RNA helicase
MGLGKTVQVLSLLATRRADKKKRAAPDLVVCPTAVVLNWQREAKKFTPSLKVYVHQGAGRALTAEALEKKRTESDVVVTSFSLARIDRALLEASPWGLVVIDEAQNLKNPDALQTRAVAALPSEARLALSGTPVENHLRDLWSIYHVVLPGLLGGPTRFAKAFMAPIKHGDPRAMDKLTRRVAPFLLRRTKADPGVAVDLPPRQEQDVWCDLSREQVTLYQAMTEATLEGLTDAKGMQRRANILTALMRFKQICNHPENFHVEKPAKLFGRSGKLDRAMEIVDELLEGGQKVVIFTQFVEMGMILTRALAERFELDAGFYHGGLNPKEREALVDDFNSADGAPVLVLSLKAGGTGLNLQAASAVIHYDRWWNPAVEEQATARAHRIGQTRSVNVYKFVTRATLEERIVAMLESKRDLAERVLASSDESWITEMNNNDLAAFLALDRGAEVTDDAR